MRLAWLGPLLLLASCAANTGGQAVLDPGHHTLIRLDERLRVRSTGAWITFSEVLEDSRCPQGVQCVWEGNARIVLLVEAETAAPVRLEFNTSSRFAQAQPFAGYTLKLLELRPAPVSGQPTREYSALLHLEASK